MRLADYSKLALVGTLVQVGCGDPSFTLTLDMRTYPPIADVAFKVDDEVAILLPDGKHRVERTYEHFDTASRAIDDTPLVVECWAGAESCGELEFKVLNCESLHHSEGMGAIVQERVDLLFTDDGNGVEMGECVGERHTVPFIQ